MPARKRSSTNSRLTSEQKRLLEAERELRRREEAIQRKLSELPAKVRERKRRERQLQQLDVATTASPEWFSRVRSSRGSAPPAVRRRRLGAEARAARIKFIVLCLILGAILLLLWQVIPA